MILCILLPEFKTLILSGGNTDITRWYRMPTPFLSFVLIFYEIGQFWGWRTQATTRTLSWTPQRDETGRKRLALLPPLASPGSASFGNTGALDRKSWSPPEDSSVQQGPGRHRPETLHLQLAYLELEAVLGL